MADLKRGCCFLRHLDMLCDLEFLDLLDQSVQCIYVIPTNSLDILEIPYRVINTAYGTGHRRANLFSTCI